MHMMKTLPRRLPSNPAELPNLYLVGFMGTGKSALGRRLAARFGMRFLDSDSEIERGRGMSVKDIFAKLGEEEFRKMEREFMEGGHPATGCVVSCGGGLVCREGMPELVKSKGVSVVLFAEPEVVFKRVSGSARRPLLNVENPLEKIRELMAARRPFYSKSGICVSSAGRIGDIEERIARVFCEHAMPQRGGRRRR